MCVVILISKVEGIMVFFRIVRGVEVEIIATQFDGDESVGIAYAPECVEAKTLDGEPFELTDDEIERFTIEAAEAAFEDCGND